MIKDTFVKYRTSSQLKRNKSVRKSVAYEQAGKVGIVYTAEDLKKHDVVKELVKKFENDGKKVDVLSFLPKDIQNFEFRFAFFTAKDINLFGSVKSEEVRSFTEKHFNYLLYLDFESDPLLRYVLAMSKAECRVGNFEEVNRPFCDLMVAPQQPNYKSLAHEMFKYIRILT